MLKLTRYIGEGESIVIDDDITITILRDDKGDIDLGINAPRDKSVHREEIYERNTTCQ